MLDNTPGDVLAALIVAMVAALLIWMIEAPESPKWITATLGTITLGAFWYIVLRAAVL